LKGLTLVARDQHIYESCCWAFRPTDDIESLVGGWIYLHPVSKNSPSEFGGVIREVHLTQREGVAIEDGYILVIEAREEGRDQAWRGANHGMAWTGGVIEASLPHEVA